MPDSAKIQAKSGPDRTVNVNLPDIEEITFRLKRRVVEITQKSGDMTEYDITSARGIKVSNAGGNFLLEIRNNPF